MERKKDTNNNKTVIKCFQTSQSIVCLPTIFDIIYSYYISDLLMIILSSWKIGKTIKTQSKASLVQPRDLWRNSHCSRPCRMRLPSRTTTLWASFRIIWMLYTWFKSGCWMTSITTISSCSIACMQLTLLALVIT